MGILYRESQTRQANVLPLVVDILDPSPGRGWAQEERAGLLQRGPADMVLALALVHHLAISGNIPLSKIAFWLSRIARTAIIEFVPKDDPALRRLLRWRQDIYTNYSQPSFESALREHFQIIEQRLLPGSGRILYSIARKEV